MVCCDPLTERNGNIALLRRVHELTKVGVTESVAQHLLELPTLAQQQKLQDKMRKAVELDPDLLEARVSLARLLQETGRPEEAAEHFRAAETINQNQP